ncbi:unnamed protein product [Aphanomyces euteiches]|uniref:C2H2-type domain-containing protein n=1 Tax=Aphanomyces euteiches TaxID=100861 RepID=A0A6G0XY14_9STRA|nr:hypothetical protein Ae201684_000094 [Aphanomyces euteiches]KAH9092044.1 hypothetical protein Ae201684P_011582 [Aphanomyces euteiches]KAH9146270.1 hypothetical protein AeRB84_009857 [Aphanomyces euteiches]
MAPVDETKGCRVLTVGDGDLSYSRSLLDKENWNDLDLDAETTVIDLVATTYDSETALTNKYAMASSNIQALTTSTASDITVQVQHDIDATDLKGYSTAPFDRIVFHHPHSGVEDVHRHRRLLSHFFHAALQVLSPEGRIYVTLARDQPERWEIMKRATLAGLHCIKQVVWNAPKGYTRKRHQSDKSFHQVVLHGEKLQQESTLFGFARPDVVVVQKDVVPPTTTPAAPVSNPEWIYACDICEGKRFATLQGQKTHMRMVHELNLKRKRGADSTAALVCQSCPGRVFSDEEALKQHRLAKHGKDSEIRPDWTEKQTPPVAAASYKCSICEDAFATQTELDNHWTTLQPIQVEKATCPSCKKEFEDLRALRQHQNFCQASS